MRCGMSVQKFDIDTVVRQIFRKSPNTSSPTGPANLTWPPSCANATATLAGAPPGNCRKSASSTLVYDRKAGVMNPKADIGFTYVMNKMQMAGDDDPRRVSLAQAVHDSIKG
jgi:hypothetical protein